MCTVHIISHFVHTLYDLTELYSWKEDAIFKINSISPRVQRRFLERLFKIHAECISELLLYVPLKFESKNTHNNALSFKFRKEASNANSFYTTLALKFSGSKMISHKENHTRCFGVLHFRTKELLRSTI